MGQAKQRGSRESRNSQAVSRIQVGAETGPPPPAIETAIGSIAVKSTRRILFNHLYQTLEERGHWHVDQMYGSGTGILIKHERAFYLLTADHVIRNACGYKFTSESPFWMPSLANAWPTDLLGFLMPGQILHIGEAVAGKGVHVDAADLVLIELFYPMAPQFYPDHFIDLDYHSNALMTQEEFVSGMLLIGAGYPFDANEFTFFTEERADGMTHGTQLNRWILDGICVLEDGEPTMGSHENEFPPLSGASGGIVTDLPTAGASARVAGLMVSANSLVVRFIPSYLISEALLHKHTCRRTAVDPAFLGQPHPEALEWLEELANRYSARPTRIRS
jgi:hypothetical protein